MLNDDLAINKINPYAGKNVFTPGVRVFGGPYLEKLPYGPPEEPVEEPAEPSQGCYWARAAGTGMQVSTVDYCSEKEGDCPLGRRLIPHRNIDPGVLDYRIVVLKKERAEKNKPIITDGDNSDIVLYLVIAICLVLLYRRFRSA